VISTQASVTIQCTQDVSSIRDRITMNNNAKADSKYDCYAPKLVTMSPEITNIRTKELVYHCHSNARGSRGAVPVHSALNGLYKDKEKDWEKSIRFIGVACTPTNLGDAANTQSQLTVRTRGTETIMNNGPDHIHIGDLVAWKVPSEEEWKNVTDQVKSRRGMVPAYDTDFEGQRVLLMTVPFTFKMEKKIGIDFDVTELNTYVSQKKTARQEKISIEELVEHFKISLELNKLVEYNRAFEERKIGKALSSAAPGCPFDILLY